MIGIGVMSGSSVDGLDVALVKFENDQIFIWELLEYNCFQLPDDLSNRLIDTPNQNVFDLIETQNLFSKFVALSVNHFIDQSDSMSKSKIEFMAVHGHTILHSPEQKFSWQLINGGYLSEATGINVVCDFRNQDIALGGQGTPIAVIADRDLYPGYSHYFNLGGIANLSEVNNDIWQAYDVFPCNQVLNYFANMEGVQYDKDGMMARTGQVNKQLLEKLHSQEFILILPPKSLDNNWIKEVWLKMMLQFELSTLDFLRTYVEFMAEQISKMIEHSSSVLFSGGGVRNSFLMERIKDLTEDNVELVIPNGITIDYKEAILIAYTGYLRVLKKTNFISTATGASSDSIGGAVYLSSRKNMIK